MGETGVKWTLENYAQNIKKLKRVKNSAENMDYRQNFICNNRRYILIRNLDRIRHVKRVTNSRTIGAK